MSDACFTLAKRIWSYAVRVGQELVVVELEDERDLVRVLARHRSEHAERRGHGVAAALDRELHDVLGVEVGRVGRERRAGGVLDALVDRQDRDVAGAAEAAGVEQRLQAPQHARRPIGLGEDAVHEVGAGQVQGVLRDRLALVRKKARSSPRIASMRSIPTPAALLAMATFSLLSQRSYRTSRVLNGEFEVLDRGLPDRPLHQLLHRQVQLRRLDLGQLRPRQRVARREQRAAVLVRDDRDRVGAERAAPRP